MEDVTIQEAQADYITRWSKNSYQHFVDGDYDWAADLIAKTKARYILEVGCGIGYSTLALAEHDIHVLSIDPIPDAIEQTKQLLQSKKISVGFLNNDEKPGILLSQANVVEDYCNVSSYIKWIDLILVCNPGGKLETELTDKELEMLHWGHYSDEQMEKETVLELHKWAVLLASARLAKEYNKLLVVIDRATTNEIDLTLDVIQEASGLRGTKRTYRKIRKAPQDGIQIGETGEELYWGAGLYLPI